MMEFLQSIDQSLFYFLNRIFVALPFDYPFIFLAAGDPLYARQVWLGIFIFSLILLFWKGGVRGRWLVGALLAGVIAGDQLSSFVIKPLVMRVRPCTALVDVRLLINCGSGYSFPSSHAVNMFCAAFIASRFYPARAGWLFLLAALIAYSRVYVGVHYPGDVLGGAVLGLVVGYSIITLFRLLIPKQGIQI